MKIKEKLGTLGDNNGFLTCSMHIAQLQKEIYDIIPYSTFEDAARSLKQKEISAMLVPAAYSKINNFIMDKEIMTNEVFLAKIPPLVYVAKTKSLTLKNVNKIYLHQATYTLIYDIGIDLSSIETCYVNSNSEACKLLLEDKSIRSVAITNKLCADYYQLNIIKVLRKGINMPWIKFINKGD